MTEKAETIHTEQTGIKEYSPIEAEIRKLIEDLKGKVYQPTTGKGMDVLSADRTKYQKIRTGLDKVRKALKADSLEYGRKVDREAKRLTNVILEGEDPLVEMIEAEKERKAKAKAERERKERERVEKIKNLLNAIDLPLPHGVTKDSVIKHLDWLHGLDIVPEFYQEFTEKAVAARDLAVTSAEAALAYIIRAEEQAAELERLRLESERRDKEEAERKAKEEADRKADEPDLPERKEVVPIPERTERSVDRDDPGQAYQCPEHGGLLSDQLEETSPPARKVLAGQTVGGGLIEETEPAGPGDGTLEPAGADTIEAAAQREPVKAYAFMVLRRHPTGDWLDVKTASMTIEAADAKGDILDQHGIPLSTSRTVVRVSCWEVV